MFSKIQKAQYILCAFAFCTALCFYPVILFNGIDFAAALFFLQCHIQRHHQRKSQHDAYNTGRLVALHAALSSHGSAVLTHSARAKASNAPNGSTSPEAAPAKNA